MQNHSRDYSLHKLPISQMNETNGHWHAAEFSSAQFHFIFEPIQALMCHVFVTAFLILRC